MAHKPKNYDLYHKALDPAKTTLNVEQVSDLTSLVINVW